MSSFLAELFNQNTLESLVGKYIGEAALEKLVPGLAKASATFNLSDIIYNPVTQVNFLTLLRETCGDETKSYIDQICADYSLIFRVECSLTFMSDHVFVELVKFMKLKHPKKGEKMFEHLADVYRENPTKNIQELMDDDTKVFLHFFQSKAKHEQEQLVAAACQIGLQPMIDIAALCIASSLRLQTEEEVRQMYKVPEKFASAIMDKLAATVPLDYVWASLLESNTQKQKSAK